MAETTITRRVLRVLRQGGFAYKTHGSAFQQAGLPDVVGCYVGIFFGIEVKVPGKTASKLQQRTIDEIIAAGGIAGCVTSVEPVKAAIAILDRPAAIEQLQVDELVKTAQEALDAARETEAKQYQEARTSSRKARGGNRSPRKTSATAERQENDEVLQWQRRARRGTPGRS